MICVNKLFFCFITFFSIPNANAREIYCYLSNAFQRQEGEMLFEYDEKNKSLNLLRTAGATAAFSDKYGWIREVLNKPEKNISTDPNTIIVSHKGAYNWKFLLNRQTGAINITQTRVSMFWRGTCDLIEKKNKF
jgi:hypothetical protein